MSNRRISSPKTFPLTGGCITNLEKTQLKSGQFSMAQNVRGENPGIRSRKGNTILHTLPDFSNGVINMYQYRQTEGSEKSVFAQMSDGDVIKSQVSIPSVYSGDFGTQIFDGTSSGSVPASFAVLKDTMVYSNGADQHQTYCGPGSKIDQLVVYDGSSAPPAMPTDGRDYSSEVRDARTYKTAVLDSLDTYANNECLFIKTRVPVKALTFTIPTANTNVSSAEVYYWGADIPEGVGGALNFGNSVAISKDGLVLVVGMKLADDDSISNRGKVYVYDRSGTSWVERGTILKPDASANEYFGAGVAVNGDGTRIAVGAPGAGTGGLVYTYTVAAGSSLFVLDAVVESSDIAASDLFGTSVSLDSAGIIMAVGAPGCDTGTGAIYAFDDSSGWAERATIKTASDAGVGDLFGSAVSLSSDGEALAVGAPGWDNAVDEGQVYVFSRNGTGWDEDYMVVSPAPVTGDYFGTSVSLNGDGTTMAVGVPGYTGTQTDQGKVYIFDFTASWTALGYIVAQDNSASDLFGTSCSLSSDGETIVIGSIGWGDYQADQGGVYTYTIDYAATVTSATPTERVAILSATGGAAYDRFGSATAISRDGLVVAVVSAGIDKVYVYTWGGAAWTEVIYSVAATSVALNSDGSVMALGNSAYSGYTGQVTIHANDGGWALRDTIPITGLSAFDRFGEAVSLSSNATILAVTTHPDVSSSSNPSVYTFDYSASTWTVREDVVVITDAVATWQQAYADAGFSVSLDSAGTVMALGVNINAYTGVS